MFSGAIENGLKYMDENTLLQELIYLTSNVMEGYTVALFINKDKNKKNIYLHTYDSFCKEIDKDCLLQPGEGLIGWVYRQQKTVVANNFERDTSTLKIYKKDENIKSLMATPLPDGRGVLFVDSKKNYTFTEKKEKIFKQLSNIFYAILCRETIFDSINRTNKFNKLYIEIDNVIIYNNFDITNKIESMMNKIIQNFDIYISIIYDEEKIYFSDGKIYYSSNFNLLKKENSLINLVMKNKKTIYKNSIKNKNNFCIVVNEKKYDNISNYLCIPLFLDAPEKRGCYFLSKSYGKHWEKNEVQFLEKLGKKIFFYMSCENERLL